MSEVDTLFCPGVLRTLTRILFRVSYVHFSSTKEENFLSRSRSLCISISSSTDVVEWGRVTSIMNIACISWWNLPHNCTSLPVTLLPLAPIFRPSHCSYIAVCIQKQLWIIFLDMYRKTTLCCVIGSLWEDLGCLSKSSRDAFSTVEHSMFPMFLKFYNAVSKNITQTRQFSWKYLVFSHVGKRLKLLSSVLQIQSQRVMIPLVG